MSYECSMLSNEQMTYDHNSAMLFPLPIAIPETHIYRNTTLLTQQTYFQWNMKME